METGHCCVWAACGFLFLTVTRLRAHRGALCWGERAGLLAELRAQQLRASPAASARAQQRLSWKPNSGTCRKGSSGHPTGRAARSLVSGCCEQAHVCVPAGQGVLIGVLTLSLCEAWLVIVLQWQVMGGSSSSLEHSSALQNQAQFLVLPGADELWRHRGEGDLEQYLPLMQLCSPKH